MLKEILFYQWNCRHLGRHTTLVIQYCQYAYDCRRIFKHDMLFVVHDKL